MSRLPRSNILAYTMPGFATSAETLANAHALMRALGAMEGKVKDMSANRENRAAAAGTDQRGAFCAVGPPMAASIFCAPQKQNSAMATTASTTSLAFRTRRAPV